MILACDQHDQTIRVGYGNNPKEIHVEEYLEHEEVLHRFQELGRKATRIVISNENAFTGELERHGITAARVPRLEAVYWGVREQLDGEDCLILSVGLTSCVAGVVKKGRLITEKAEPNLTLKQIWQDLLNQNLPLQQAVERLIARGKEPSRVEREIFEGFLNALRGVAVQAPIPFLPPLKLPHTTRIIHELLNRLNPQRELKTLILTDWAVFGSLSEPLREGYRVVASSDNPFTTALRGMVSLGLKDVQATSEKEEFQRFLSSFQTLYANKNYDACLQTLKQITAMNPSYAEAPKLAAQIEKALSDLVTQREKEQKSLVNTALKNARKQYDEGNLDHCKETLDVLLRDHPTHEKGLHLREEVNAAIAERDRLKGLLGKVVEYLSRKQYRAARREYHRALTNSDVRNQSWAKDSISSIEAEFRAHRAALHKRVLVATVALLAAALLATYLSMESYKPPTPAPPPPAARDYIQKMISLAEVNGGIGREHEILEAWHNIKRMNVKDSIPCSSKGQARELNKLGRKYSDQKNYKEALKYYTKALQACGNDVEVTHNVGYALMQIGSLGDAEGYLFKALSLGNDNTRTINMFALGQTYARQGQHKIPSAVASFANAYLFSRDRDKTRHFLRDLASNDDNAYVRTAAEQALRLKLVRG